MAQGKTGVTPAREEELLAFIREELLFGRTVEEIRDKVRRKAPMLAPSTIKNWIERMIEAISVTKATAAHKDFRMGLADARLHDLYRRALERNDDRLAFDIVKHYTKIHGLEKKSGGGGLKIGVMTNGAKTAVGISQGGDEDEESNTPALGTDELRKIVGEKEPMEALRIAHEEPQEAELVSTEGEDDGDED